MVHAEAGGRHRVDVGCLLIVDCVSQIEGWLRRFMSAKWLGGQEASHASGV